MAQRDLELYPDRYGHIWEGEYGGAADGAHPAYARSAARRRHCHGFAGSP